MPLATPPSRYCGRFAPSPSGPLHVGSLMTAVGGYLEARKQGGKWLVRIEDLDIPRIVPGSADDMLRALEALGLYWDGPVLYQSQRLAAYQEVLHQIKSAVLVYPCTCSRKDIADSAIMGTEGLIYSGTCRSRRVTATVLGSQSYAWRVRTISEIITLEDVLQGRLGQSVENEIGDFTLLRADGVFTYQFAVVIDDAFQGVTDVVRGVDLFSSTPRQIYLQRLLNFRTPNYAHLPVAVNAHGEKLSKQTLAPPIDLGNFKATLLRVLKLLHQRPPADLVDCDLATMWEWALGHWSLKKLRGIRTVKAD